MCIIVTIPPPLGGLIHSSRGQGAGRLWEGSDLPPFSIQGGVLGIKIGWVCDLDKAWDQCIPKYSFTRLDGISEKSSISPGYNFR